MRMLHEQIQGMVRKDKANRCAQLVLSTNGTMASFSRPCALTVRASSSCVSAFAKQRISPAVLPMILPMRLVVARLRATGER